MPVATAIENPKTRDGVRSIRVQLAKSEYPATARIHDRPGDYHPYAKGDRLTLEKLEGDPDAAFKVTGIFGSDPSPRDANNRVVAARDKDLELQAPNGDVRATAATDGKVRLGGGEDEDHAPVAINDEVQRDSFSLQAQLDQALTAISAADPGLAAALLTEMQKVIPGWAPLPYIGEPQQRAPVSLGAEDVVAKPAEGGS